jgi:hypothetical protein
MRIVMIALLVVAFAASATVKTGGNGTPNPWSSRGTYTVEDVLAGGLNASYGLAIKTDTPNSIWILNWSEMADFEFDMVTGGTGDSWLITGGVDPDDQAYAEFATGNQWFMTDYVSSMFAVFEDNGTHIANIAGPAGYTNLFGIGAGGGYVYVGSPNEETLAWGAYTGTETSVSWIGEITYSSVYGLAVWENYLFVACGISDADNIFIHEINPDGSPNPVPVWSAAFVEEASMNGGIDYCGEYLWVYPQNTYLYKLSIDFDPQALESDTWGGIKSAF